MRSLWAIERAILEAAAHDYQASADVLREQIAAAQITDFENTGAGFFSMVSMPSAVRRLMDKSPLDAATGTVGSIEHGMGFLVFIEDGHVSLIEGYTYGDVSTVGVDFESASFDVKPWSMAAE